MSQFVKVYHIPSSRDGKLIMKQVTKFMLDKFRVSLVGNLRVNSEYLEQTFRYYVTVGKQAPFPRDVVLLWKEQKRTPNKSTYNLFLQDHRYRESKITSLLSLYHMVTIIPVPVIDLMPQDK